MATPLGKSTLGIAVVILAIAFGITAYTYSNNDRARVLQFEREISAEPDLTARITVYQNLLKAMGADQAQDILEKSDLPHNAETHLINHESGKFLYATEGATGIIRCKNYLEESCFHGFLIAFIADRGINDVGTLLHMCNTAPTIAGGSTLQCAHGLGHAFLAHTGGEKLPDALGLCEKTFEKGEKGLLYCEEGVFMQHAMDKAGTAFVPDPLETCKQPTIAGHAGATEACWLMQSQFTLDAELYPQFRGDPALVVAYCRKLSDAADTKLCLLGLADQAQQTSGNDMTVVKNICVLEGDMFDACIAEAAARSYEYGNRELPFALCNTQSGTAKDRCFESVYFGIRISYTSPTERERACMQFGNSEERSACIAWQRKNVDGNPAFR